MALAARNIGRLASLALVAGTLVVTTGTGAAHAADAVAGGLTAGDSLFPNQGNSGYDALHYDIDLTVDVDVASTNNALAATTFPAATTSVRARTTGSPLSSYAFDFQGSTSTLEASTLNVDSVTVNGAPATFSRIENTTIDDATTDVHKLVVTPATPVDGEFTTIVKYSGAPVRHTDTDESYEGWNNTTDGATFVNQPVGSMTAFPNNNTPRDKATYTISVDAPSKLSTSATAAASNPGLKPAAVVSNGELRSKTPSKDGARTTWVWDQKKPMASMLSLISVGRYDVYESSITLASGRVLPEWSFIDPAISVANQQTTQSTRRQLKQILDFLESKYGPYPGNSVGVVTDVVPSAINYALETQDRSFFPNSAGRSTTIHELTHQWYGDGVSPTDWNDIWISEGTATYAEALTAYESAGTSTTPTETSYFNSWNSAATTSSLWRVPTAKMTEASQLFGSQVYTRGAMTLEALRTAIGAADFTRLIKEWQLRYTGTSRRTTDFIALAEEISGRDLSAFFTAWIYTSGKPAWPAKFTLSLVGPTAPVTAGQEVGYTLTSRNTGKVEQTDSVVTIDLKDVLDDAALGSLPAGVTVDGSALTWTVPSTAVGATSAVTIPATVAGDATGSTLTAVARASTLGSTCGDCGTSIVVGTQPVAPAPVPTITGDPVVGQELTARTSGWATGSTFTYQWLVDNTPVAGATKPTYTPGATAAGLAVRVAVTGSKGSASPVSRTSEPTAIVTRATQAGSTPVISGTPKIGQRLTVDVGTWQAGTYFTYQWAVNGTNVSGANGGTGPTFTPSLAAQSGQVVTVTVTGTKGGLTNTVKTSEATAAVAPGEFGSVPTPTLDRAPRALASVTAVPGIWEDNTTFSYQWSVGGSPVTGATTATFTPTLAQVGLPITVAITGTKPGYPTPLTKTSETVDIGPAAQTVTPTPTISGAPQVGVELTGESGTWDEGTTLAYQWLVGGVAVDGATRTTFTPSGAASGETITLAVTSTKPGYATTTRTSEPTAAVAAGVLADTATPTISGAAKVGAELTAVAGTWDDGVSLAYQWVVDGEGVDGATGARFTPGPGAVGDAVTVTVTGTRVGYTAVTKTSEPTGAVASGDLAATPSPALSGKPQVGRGITAVPGRWDDGTTLTYQWLRDGAPIPGATRATHDVTAADHRSILSVVVTGSKPGHVSVSRSSSGVRIIAGVQKLSPKPSITGQVKAGRTLKVKRATYDAGVRLSYRWYVDGRRAGGNKPSLKVATSFRGKRIQVRVTAARTGYLTKIRISTKTSRVK
jgi:hypothetical protein